MFRKRYVVTLACQWNKDKAGSELAGEPEKGTDPQNSNHPEC